MRANHWLYGGGMASSRFNDGYRRRAISRSATGGSQWIQIPEPRPLAGSARSGQKKIFVIVSPPIPTPVDGKTIRRIVIFDNHPDSLRLVLDSGVNVESDDAASRGERRTSIICGLILIAMLVAALLWALC
jgi:hypothetical protein